MSPQPRSSEPLPYGAGGIYTPRRRPSIGPRKRPACGRARYDTATIMPPPVIELENVRKSFAMPGGERSDVERTQWLGDTVSLRGHPWLSEAISSNRWPSGELTCSGPSFAGRQKSRRPSGGSSCLRPSIGMT